MINSGDPDQLASSEANWSGSTMFAKTRRVLFSKRRVNAYGADYWNVSYLYWVASSVETGQIIIIMNKH